MGLAVSRNRNDLQALATRLSDWDPEKVICFHQCLCAYSHWELEIAELSGEMFLSFQNTVTNTYRVRSGICSVGRTGATLRL